MIGSLNLDPGSEIIVPSWTMCATATTILRWNCIPVFADIDDYFCIDPESVRSLISDQTRAIIAVDIFGQSCDVQTLKEIAQEYSLYLVGDTAQAPGTYFENSHHTGCEYDIGGFSLNRHKHIQTGEGGLIVTNNDLLAESCRRLRNHGETIFDSHPAKNIYGANMPFR